MFKKSFFLIRDSFGYFLACIGLDVLFLIALGFFTAPVSAKMKFLLLQIAGVFSQNMQELDRGQTFLTALFSSGAIEFWKPLIVYLILFLIIIFILYVIIQSVAWNLSLIIANKKIKYVKYLKSFAIINLFWFALFIIYNLLDLVGNLNKAATPDLKFNLFSVFAGVFILLLGYFAIISYSTLKIKKSFKLGWKHRNLLFSKYFIILLYFFILNFILARLAELNYILAITIGLILFLPALTYARVFMIENINKVD